MTCTCQHCRKRPGEAYLIELVRQLAVANAMDDGTKAANLVPRVVEEIARHRHREYGLPLDRARMDVARELARAEEMGR